METNEAIEQLNALQDILAERIEVESSIQRIPENLRDQEEMLIKLKKDFLELNREFEEARTEAEMTRGNLLEAEGIREKAERNMDQISTQREYEALDKEINEASDKERKFQKELTKRNARVAELNGRIESYTGLIATTEEDIRGIKEKIEAEMAEKQARLNELKEREKETAADLDPEIYFKLERIIKNKAGKGIVAIRGGVCQGCHMILPAQFANDVRENKRIIFCPYCSRILRYEEAGEGGEDFFDDEDSGSLADLEDLEEEEFEVLEAAEEEEDAPGADVNVDDFDE